MRRLICAAAALLALVCGAAGAATVDPELRRRSAGGEAIDVIVEYDATTIEQSIAARRARLPGGVANAVLLADAAARYRQLRRDADRASSPPDVQTLRDFSHLPMRVARVRTSAALAALAANPQVRALYRNGQLQRVLAQSLPLISQPAVSGVGYGGAGTTVAVIDDGIALAQAAFGGCTAVGTPAGCRIVANLAFAATPGTNFTHGTNVSAVVAGVAPQASLAMLNVFSASGATFADVIAAIDWTIANRDVFNIVAINMSLGDGSSNTAACATGNPFALPVANALAAGISVVAAAGNAAFANGSFVPGIANPACAPGVISVGAVYDANVGGLTWGTAPNQCTDGTSQAGQIACFSQSAAILTVLAPGALITAGGSTLGGTSQASPHVAGAVAVLRAAFPAETLAAMQARLTTSSVQATDPRNGITRPRLMLADAAKPANDAFANRLALTGSGGSATGTTLLATRESGEPQHAAAGAHSVWWSWTAPATGQVSLSTAGSGFDTLLAVYTGSAPAALAAVASNDNAGGAATSALHFQAQAGTAYHWAVDGAGGAQGRVALQWSLNSAASADLSASISGPGVVAAGATVPFVVTVFNAGPQPATGVRLTLNLPAGVRYAGGPAECSATGVTVLCRSAELPAGASAAWTVLLAVSNPGNGLSFSETVAADLPDPVGSNNLASLSVPTAVPAGDVPALPPWAAAALAGVLLVGIRRAAA